MSDQTKNAPAPPPAGAPPGYVDQPYPKWIYHPDGSSKVIDSPAQEEAGWYDTATEAAAHADKKTAAKDALKDEAKDDKAKDDKRK